MTQANYGQRMPLQAGKHKRLVCKGPGCSLACVVLESAIGKTETNQSSAENHCVHGYAISTENSELFQQKQKLKQF